MLVVLVLVVVVVFVYAVVVAAAAVAQLNGVRQVGWKARCFFSKAEGKEIEDIFKATHTYVRTHAHACMQTEAQTHTCIEMHADTHSH